MPTASLTELRNGVPLTQEELAKKARVGRQSVVRIELGDTKYPRPSTVRRLSKALGKPTDEIMAACRESWRRVATQPKKSG